MSKLIVTEFRAQSDPEFWSFQIAGAIAKRGLNTYMKLANGFWQSSSPTDRRLTSEEMAEEAAPTRGPLEVLPGSTELSRIVEWRRPGVWDAAPTKLGTVVHVHDLGNLVRVIPAGLGINTDPWIVAEGTEAQGITQFHFSDDEVLAYLSNGSGKIVE